MHNQEIVKILREMALMYEMDDVQFKPRAYEKAALSVEALNDEIKTVYEKGGTKALTEISGIGQGIAHHLEDLFKTGHIKEYEKLKKKTPVNIAELTQVEGVGAKMVKTLYKKLGIKNLKDLERSAKAGKISKLEHFGEKSEQKILKGIEFLKSSGGRQVLGHIHPELSALETLVRNFPEVDQAMLAGSVRRAKETIGDVDILAVSKDPQKVMERFVGLPQVAHVFAKGPTKTMVKLKNGLDADIRVVPKKSFGAALNYFTGSKYHNVALREVAIKKGWKLNEYGLYKGNKFIAGESEEELYKKLGLHYIEPELREMTGELEASKNNKLPKLIEHGSLKGDLQVQTDWTDGKHSIEVMAKAAKDLGLEYIAITDHTKSLAMTGGSDEKKLLRQMAEIDKINKNYREKGLGFRILKGAEVNIGKDGSLDIEDNVLAKLDVVGAAVHSHFKLTKEEQTDRVLKAMENPNVDVIFHLTGRIINKREPIELDVDEIIIAAKRSGTILEIDAYPDRSDLKDEYIKKCVEAGVKMSIDSDAHSKEHFKYLEYGISQARRGWASKEDIINAWPVEKMLKMLKK